MKNYVPGCSSESWHLTAPGPMSVFMDSQCALIQPGELSSDTNMLKGYGKEARRSV